MKLAKLISLIMDNIGVKVELIPASPERYVLKKKIETKKPKNKKDGK